MGFDELLPVLEDPVAATKFVPKIPFDLHLAPPIENVSLLRSPWPYTFRQLVSVVDSDLLLVSPFIKVSGSAQVLSELERRGIQNTVRVKVLSNLRPESALNGSLDLEAMLELGKALPQFDLIHLPSLHAKVYVADNKMAVVTSANLTERGLRGNLEYGAAFTNKALVEEIRRDFENYELLGGKVSPQEVGELLDEINDLKVLFNSAERTIRARAKRAFKAKLQETQLSLMRRQAKGKTTQGILCDTILFILARGPLRTVDLHPLVQRLQPDLCDDSIDRVIDGVHFGKRWKHHVRSAQHFLKRQGRIHYDSERWHLASQS